MIKFLLLQLLVHYNVVLGIGMLPKEYTEGDIIPIFVSQIESRKVKVPYSYYDVGTCRPEKYENEKNLYVNKNWGEALAGERWAYSPYEVTIRTQKTKDFDPSEF